MKKELKYQIQSAHDEKKRTSSFKSMSKKNKTITLISIILGAILLTTLGFYIFQITEQPFSANDKISFQIYFNQGNGNSGNLYLYYLNSSGMTENEIGLFLTNHSNFIDYYLYEFDSNGNISEILANESFYYRFYVNVENYTGAFGYVARGLNKVYLNLLPTSLFIDLTSETYQHNIENTTEQNWTITYSQIGHGFNTYYNKTIEKKVNWVLKFEFDGLANEAYVNVSWFSYEYQNTLKVADGNNLYVEIMNYAFENTYLNPSASLNFRFFEGINSIINVTKVSVGYGDSTNFILLGSHS